MKQKLHGPTLHRAASGVEVLDDAKRTFRISFSSSEPYTRSSWFSDPWVEVLGHDADEVDLARIDGGAAPLLWGHDAYERDAHIGIVEKAWVEGDRGYADVRLSSRDGLADLWNDIRDGVVRNVSVGYQIHERTLVRAVSDGPSEYRVTRWTPMELSLVSVPADPSVGVGRQHDGGPALFTVEDLETKMDNNPQAPTPATAPAEDAIRTATETATRAERERVSAIRRAVDGLDIHAETVTRWIEDGKDVTDVRAEIIEALRKKETPMNPRISVGDDMTRAATVAGVESVILSRMGGGEISEQGRPFAYLSMVEMARSVLRVCGKPADGLSRHEVASRFLRSHSTDDFPYILANVANKRLQKAYNELQPTYTRWARRAPNAPDFKTISVNRLSAAPALSLKLEGAEVTYGTLSEDREQYTIATYARGLRVTREMIVNDDLRAFDRAMMGFSSSARRLENSLVYTQLTANAAMNDGVALFHATHGNLSTGGTTALDATNGLAALGAARKLLRKQTGMASEKLNLEPRYIIVPAALEQAAYQFTSSAYLPVTSGTVNEFRAGGRTAVEPIVDSLLDDSSAAYWYMAADSAQIDTVEYCYLDGAEGVYTEQQVDFDTDGISVKARLDFAAKVIDWRGLVRSNGS